mmetsp:Transcript_12540/g.43635  ORF Transcript_12540/g.43635 Transcript_12540/m.43635 type:complete len:284 (-) Transcript_12540:3129-3980(-)
MDGRASNKAERKERRRRNTRSMNDLPRPDTSAQYREFVRELHFRQDAIRQKLHSLPEIERSSKQEPLTIHKSKSKNKGGPTLPEIKYVATDYFNHEIKPKIMKMLPSLSHQSYRADSSLQQLSSTSTTTSVFITDNPETERNKVMVKKKQANNSYNEVVLDDIVAWQPGLVQRAMDGRGILKIRSEKEFLPNTLDTGMALQKAQGVVKLVQLRDKVIKTRMQAKGNFKGELLPIAPRSDVDFVTQNKHKQFQSTQDAKITDLLKACAERVQRELETCERAIVR